MGAKSSAEKHPSKIKISANGFNWANHATFLLANFHHFHIATAVSENSHRFRSLLWLADGGESHPNVNEKSAHRIRRPSNKANNYIFAIFGCLFQRNTQQLAGNHAREPNYSKSKLCPRTRLKEEIDLPNSLHFALPI